MLKETISSVPKTTDRTVEKPTVCGTDLVNDRACQTATSHGDYRTYTRATVFYRAV